MRFSNYLNIILGQKTKIKALRYFVNHDKQVSIRALAQAIKITPPNLARILNELNKENVLVRHEYGRSVVFSLNYGHYLVDQVVAPLFRDEKLSITELTKTVIKKISFPFESIVLFGSLARKSEHPSSDIDLAIVVDGYKKKSKDDIEKELLNINEITIKKFGNQLSPYILTKKEFAQKYKNRDSLILSIAKDGEVLAGKLISELL